jgi:hypothetical protein
VLRLLRRVRWLLRPHHMESGAAAPGTSAATLRGVDGVGCGGQDRVAGLGCCLPTDLCTPFVVVGRRMAAWGPARPHRRIKVAVLGSLLCEDGDLPEAGPS